jgi:tetratricopeptide (TPR) repeat protein
MRNLNRRIGCSPGEDNSKSAIMPQCRHRTNGMLKGLAYLLAFFFFAPSLLGAEDSDLGRRIYADCAKSVFVLYAQSPAGEFVAQGSGFWVAGRKIVTNAHVANAGKIYVDVGSARVLAKIQSLDAFNDLAILTVDIEITAKPLALADTAPSPGDLVFAIGNPRGLERSISQGVVSATREIDHRDLLQLTAPISHGSSGGPIVNVKGQVVGVAVGFLESGQSLNFAVPAAKVTALLKSGSPKLDLGLLDQIESLRDQHQQETYSADPESAWQKTAEQIKTLLQKAFETAGNNDSVLLRVAKIANDDWDTDIAISTAERLVSVKPSSEAHVVLAQALTQKYTFAQDDAAKQKLMSQAEKEARLGVSAARSPSAESYNVLANVLEDRGSYKEAQSTFRLALNTARTTDDSDLELSSRRGLIRCADALLEFDEAGRLLQALTQEKKSTAWDWSYHADKLFAKNLYQQAGDSYRTAAELKGPYRSWCYAANSYSIAVQKDSVLFCARKCIENGTGEKGSEPLLGIAHREIADILNERGVYTEGLNHAKEATVLISDDCFGYDAMATALIGLRRFDEAINVEQQALRLSDGQYAWMHFRLGSAYFSLENWDFALQSFQKASELDRKEPASAFNVALCHQKLRHWFDAIRWYQEYLKRNPTADDKAHVLETIRLLSQ